jgi:hypothetical protein
MNCVTQTGIERRNKAMKKIYIVTFERHINCTIRDIVFHCEANNAKEAVQIAKDAWTKKSYPFHIHAVKSRVQDIDHLTIHTWLSTTISGAALMNAFYCTDSRTWRVNGRNLYGA